MRLLNELAKSTRLEDAGYLLMLSEEDERDWFRTFARQCATKVVNRIAQTGDRRRVGSAQWH
jgi:hypothetical protein